MLVAVWLVVNLNDYGGGLKHQHTFTGYPFPYATWGRGCRLVEFDPVGFAMDLGVLAALVPVALACAWSRERGPSEPGA